MVHWLPPAFRQQSMEDIHIYLYLYCFFFFKHIHLKRLGLINIFHCPVTMAIGSADIILNLIFQLPQCASPVSWIIESLCLPLSPLIYYLPVAPSHHPKGIHWGFFSSFHFVYALKINPCVIPLPALLPFDTPTPLSPSTSTHSPPLPLPSTPAANLRRMTGNVGRSW